MVFLLFGLSGAGKTTLGKSLTQLLRSQGRPVVFLDGDELRSSLGRERPNIDYTLESRREIAMVTKNLVRMIASQRIDVVCASIQLFDDIRKQFRVDLESYFEVFMDAPLDVLQKRDVKGLYKLRKAEANAKLVGVDFQFSPEETWDFRVDSSENVGDIDGLAKKVIALSGALDSH